MLCAVLIPFFSTEILGLDGLSIGWWGWLFSLVGANSGANTHVTRRRESCGGGRRPGKLRAKPGLRGVFCERKRRELFKEWDSRRRDGFLIDQEVI